MGRRAWSMVLHAAGGALAGTILAVVLLVAVELLNGVAAQPAAPLPDRLGAAVGRLDAGALPLMATFGLASGLAIWAVGGPRGPR